MKPEEIGQAYNSITHLWQSDKFNRTNGIAQHQRAVAFTQQQRTALDVGCGCTGRIIDLLIAEGFTTEGIDISAEMIRLAQQRHPQIRFYHQDICEWELPQRYDFISAWDSIWHVPLTQQEALLTKLFNGLNSGGVCIFSCGGTDVADDHTDNTMGPEVYYSTLGIPGFLNLIAASDCICRHLEYDQYPELHSYFIVQKI